MAKDQPALLVGRTVRRLAVAAVALVSVAIDFHLPADRYFAYFTVLTNLGIGAWFLASVFRGALNRWSAVRLALTVYGLVTVTVYWAFLAPTHHPQGLNFFANLGLHLVVPLAMAAEDLVVPWPRVGSRVAIGVLAFPLAYCGFSLVRGQLTGWYPYFFLNPAELGGWAGLAAFLVILLGLFVVLAFAWRLVVHGRQAK